MNAVIGDIGDVAFPPVGWLTNRQTAERLGVGTDTLISTWKYRDMLKAAARTVRKPGGGRCNLYPVELVERIAGEREASARSVVPDGYVDSEGAAKMLSIAPGTWRVWLADGTVSIESSSMPGTGNVGRRRPTQPGDGANVGGPSVLPGDRVGI